MHCKSFSCRSFIPFLHDLSITGPQKFHIALLLVLLYLSEECFTVVSQTFIYVDLAISSACFRNQLRRQMACVLSQEDIQGLHCKYPGNSIQFLIILLCVKFCLNYKGFHEYGFHLLSLTPRPLLDTRT